MILKTIIGFFLFVGSVLANQGVLNIYVSSGVGSLSDTSIRATIPVLEKELNRKIIVYNVPGANGLIGINKYLEQPTDGNSIYIGGTQIAYNSVIENRPELLDRLEPLYGLTRTNQQVLVPNNSKIKSINDLLVVQSTKGFLNGGSAHPSTEISIKLLDSMFGTNTTIINYRQNTQLANDLVAGHIDYTISGRGNIATAGFIQSGQLRVVADLKDLNIEEFSWTGFYINSEVPDYIKINLLNKISKSMKLINNMPIGYSLLPMDNNHLKILIKKEYEIIKSYVK